jgi:hypothetical protein
MIVQCRAHEQRKAHSLEQFKRKANIKIRTRYYPITYVILLESDRLGVSAGKNNKSNWSAGR